MELAEDLFAGLVGGVGGEFGHEDGDLVLEMITIGFHMGNALFLVGKGTAKGVDFGKGVENRQGFFVVGVGGEVQLGHAGGPFHVERFEILGCAFGFLFGLALFVKLSGEVAGESISAVIGGQDLLGKGLRTVENLGEGTID